MEQMVDIKEEKLSKGMMELYEMGYLNFTLNKYLLTKHKFNMEPVMEKILDG
eukprot:CAMPEP_0170549536 /NCGR_PEP_ID=MMETSP0211-20121228/7676_1 /TAXON_ID=311385 /ORGANISM="Pseudokeronopsis sp., Strain OXSARD2" /LENGTH=51 /DNA_ID=CAMNT_0010855597 /DNA_START=929 /DNA_END=1081 /DNA_ORIENTATION=+